MSLHRLFINWLELILLVAITVVGIALQFMAREHVAREQRSSKPFDAAFDEAAGVVTAEEMLTRTSAEQAEVRKQWVEARLVLVNAIDCIAHLESRYPGLATGKVDAVPPEEQDAHKTCLKKRHANTAAIGRLAARLDDLATQRNQQQLAVEAARRDAAMRLEEAIEKFTFETAVDQTVWSMASSAVLLAVAGIFLKLAFAHSEIKVRSAVVVGSAAVALLVAIVVNAAGSTAAILSGALVIIVVLALMLRNSQ